MFNSKERKMKKLFKSIIESLDCDISTPTLVEQLAVGTTFSAYQFAESKEIKYVCKTKETLAETILYFTFYLGYAVLYMLPSGINNDIYDNFKKDYRNCIVKILINYVDVPLEIASKLMNNRVKVYDDVHEDEGFESTNETFLYIFMYEMSNNRFVLDATSFPIPLIDITKQMILEIEVRSLPHFLENSFEDMLRELACELKTKERKDE